MRSQKGKQFYLIYYTDGTHKICPPNPHLGGVDENSPIKMNHLPKDVREEAKMMIEKYKQDFEASKITRKPRPSSA